MSDQFMAERSGNIHVARYEKGALFVDFRNKAGVRVSTYRYDGTLLKDGSNPVGGFPVDLWERFKAADSKGRFFANNVRFVYKGVKQ